MFIKQIKYFLVLFAVVFMQGCTSNISGQFHYFQLVKSDTTATSTINNVTYYSKESLNYKIKLAILEYQKVFVLSIEVANKTQNIIEPENYSIALFDGRDMKTLKLIPKSDLIKLISKNSANSGIESQVLNAVANAISTPFNEKVRLIEYALNNYFEFRPLYANEKRSGLLLYYLDSREEDPITVQVKIDNDTGVFEFMPKK